MRYISILIFLLISFSLFSENIDFYQQKKIDNYIKYNCSSNNLIVRRSGGSAGGRGFSSRGGGSFGSSSGGYKGSSTGFTNSGSYSSGYIDSNGDYKEGKSIEWDMKTKLLLIFIGLAIFWFFKPSSKTKGKNRGGDYNDYTVFTDKKDDKDNKDDDKKV